MTVLCPLQHKEKGIKFFNAKDNKEAAFRFTKALKIVLSIPIDVEGTSSIVDGVSLIDINKLKGNLFNNLSSCYFRNQYWAMVINLCTKVLQFDRDNVKALYKIGVAYENDRNFEEAKAAFCRVLKLEPQNKACAEHLACVKSELKKADIKVNNMVKKMFSTAIEN
ncbi:hypothetical protein NQ314_012796 [Rhamnusium bicolor]|uniref:Uncharacterized protein n=1 Tax=Rhamnusium bicolor TaxID=1586634 RepID=A0AAV8XBL9_9CUCU|nr:hypothetical protein NQ314_012796 [Rhamnusium bicolor]